MLRPYRREAVDALYSYPQRGGGEDLIVIPTGGGKSLVVAHAFRLPRQAVARLVAVARNIEWRPAPLPCEATEDGGTGRPRLAGTALRRGWKAAPQWSGWIALACNADPVIIAQKLGALSKRITATAGPCPRGAA